MKRRGKKIAVNSLRNLRNVGRKLFVQLSSPEKQQAPKNESIPKMQTRLSPCMASKKRSISGQTGKRNRHSMRPELEMFQRRRIQRERMVAAVRQIHTNNKAALKELLETAKSIQVKNEMNTSIVLSLLKEHDEVSHA